MERYHTLDTQGLALSVAASVGLMYVVTAVIALFAPTIAQRITNVVPTGIDVNAAFAWGTFFVGLIVAGLVGLAMGALIASIYNAYVEGQHETAEVRHTRHAHAAHH